MKRLKKLFLYAAMLGTAITNLGTATAQDTYIPVANYKLHNTASGSTITFPGSTSTFSYTIDHQPVFNSAGYLMFSITNNTATSGFTVGNPNLSGSATGPTPQVFSIPGICNNYYSLSVQYATGTTPYYGNVVVLGKINASAVTALPGTTGYPTTAAPQVLATASLLGYSAVAAPLNADGTRHIYVMRGTMGMGAASATLLRYTISYTGVASGPSTIGTNLPLVATPMHISPDGASIAYFDNTGKFTTCNTTTGTFTSYTGMTAPVTSGSPGMPAGIYQQCGVVQTTVGGSRRWYANNGTAFGYYIENSAGSFNALSGGNGVNCTMALGKNGRIYFGQYDATSGDTRLYNYTPVVSGLGTFTFTGAVLNDIAGLSSGFEIYTVNNHVEGEDIDRAFVTPASINFNINSVTGTAASPGNIVLCGGATALNITPSISGSFSNYSITVEKGNWSSGVFTPLGGASTQTYTNVSSTFPVTNLLSVLPFLSGYTGYMRVTVNAGSCGASTQQVFKITTGVSITGLNFTVSGVSGTTSVPAIIYQCPGSTALPYLPSVTAGASSVTGYTISVVKGTYSGSVFTPVGSPVSQVNTGTLPTSAVDLAGIFPSYLSPSPVGYIQVTLSVTGLCNSVVSTQLFNVQNPTPVSGVNFTVGGQTQTTSTPADVWQCGGSTAIPFLPSVAAGSSFVTGYTITVENGSYGTSFMPSGSPASNVYTGALPTSSIDLYTAFPGYFTSPVGYIKVTLSVNGMCNTSSSVQIFKVQNATAAVDFSVIGPSSCTSFQTRMLAPITGSSPAFTCPTPPCVNGWLGALSLGLTGATASASGGFSSYTISIDEYDATGTTLLMNVINSTVPATSLPASFNFNSLTSAWFISNYSTIKGINAFKVTVSINSAYCGIVSTTSWFKIIDGGTCPTGNYFKPSDPSAAVADFNAADDFYVSPIPANEAINFEWTGAGDKSASIEISDILGKVLNQSTIAEIKGANKQTVDISALPAGMYIYKFSGENGIKTGKFQKL